MRRNCPIVMVLVVTLLISSSAYASDETDVGALPVTSPSTSDPVTPQQPENSDQTPTATNSPASQQAINPVSHRAALLVQSPEDQQGIKTYIGSVIWHIDYTLDRLPILVADVDLGDALFKASMRIAKNIDPHLPATHTIELHFTQTAISPVPGVEKVALPQMRIEKSPAGEALSGIAAMITTNNFLIGLRAGEVALTRNLDLLETRAWFDLPLLLNNGKIAKITFEKGITGQRMLESVIASWQAIENVPATSAPNSAGSSRFRISSWPTTPPSVGAVTNIFDNSADGRKAADAPQERASQNLESLMTNTMAVRAGDSGKLDASGDVAAGADALTAPQSPPLPNHDGPRQTPSVTIPASHSERSVISGRPSNIVFLYSVNPDCSGNGIIDARLVKLPDHGTLKVKSGRFFPNFLASNLRSKCNSRKVLGVVGSYESVKGYIGDDTFSIRVIDSLGIEEASHYLVHVY